MTREQSSIIGQFVPKLAAARRRRDRKLPPYPHDNEILRWRGEAENALPPLLVVGRWVTLNEVQEVYALKTRAAASMVFDNLRTRGFKFEKGGRGWWRLTYIPSFHAPNEPMCIEERVIAAIIARPDITGEELRAKLPDLTEKQVRGAVDSYRARHADKTVEGQYQPGFNVGPTRASVT